MDGLVYVVESLEGTENERVLHRKLILPFPYLIYESRTANGCLERKGHRRDSQNKKQSYNGILTRMFINSSSNEEYELWTMVQRTGNCLDPCAA